MDRGIVSTQVNQPGCPLAGPGARTCFRLLPVKDFRIWSGVGAWTFWWPREPPGFQLPKIYTILRFSYRSKPNVFEEGRLPVFAAP